MNRHDEGCIVVIAILLLLIVLAVKLANPGGVW